jgi:aspartyl-tRNA synthetase
MEFDESGRYHAAIILYQTRRHAFIEIRKVRANAYDMVLNGNEIEEDLFVFTIKRRNS